LKSAVIITIPRSGSAYVCMLYRKMLKYKHPINNLSPENIYNEYKNNNILFDELGKSNFVSIII